MAPFIPAQSSFGIAAVLPWRRVSPSPCAPASPAPARTEPLCPGKPQPLLLAGCGSRRLARVVRGQAGLRGGPGMPPPPGRGSAPR